MNSIKRTERLQQRNEYAKNGDLLFHYPTWNSPVGRLNRINALAFKGIIVCLQDKSVLLANAQITVTSC